MLNAFEGTQMFRHTIAQERTVLWNSELSVSIYLGLLGSLHQFCSSRDVFFNSYFVRFAPKPFLSVFANPISSF
jgi:hypothetical protein